jgi:uncharacterized protein YcbX
MGAEALDEVETAWHGFAGDRRWGFVRDRAAGSGFPWLTLRQRPDLIRYRPVADDSRMLVCTPSGALLDVTDPALAAELGPGVRALKLDRGAFDSAPLSLLTTRGVADVGALVGTPVDPLRFRPNLLIETELPEEEWVGRVLRVGDAQIRIDRRDRRCAVVNVDPATARRDPSVLRAIVREHESTLGVYATPVIPGRIAIGDPVLNLGMPVSS